MENMQNVTAALNTLGVKTCLACGKAGAKSLCMGCNTVYFCGKACQTQAWPGHKKECRRIVREKARVLDKAAADFAADEAIAADAFRAVWSRSRFEALMYFDDASSTRVEGTPRYYVVRKQAKSVADRL